MRFDCREHIGTGGNKFKNTYRSHKIFDTSAHFIEITKLFKQLIIHYIDNLQCSYLIFLMGLRCLFMLCNAVILFNTIYNCVHVSFVECMFAINVS